MSTTRRHRAGLRTPACVLRRPALAALVLTAACAEWPVSNPYDPVFAIEPRLVGPDTVRRYGDTLVFRVETEPAWRSDWPPLRVSWSVREDYSAWGNLAGLELLGEGRVVVRSQNEERYPFTVVATVGGREVARQMYVRRRPGAIRASVRNITVHDASGIGVLPYDSSGRVIDPILLKPIPTGISRNPSIVGVTWASRYEGDWRFALEPRATGDAMIDISLAMSDGRILRDSVAVAVRLAP